MKPYGWQHGNLYDSNKFARRWKQLREPDNHPWWKRVERQRGASSAIDEQLVYWGIEDDVVSAEIGVARHWQMRPPRFRGLKPETVDWSVE